MSDRASDPRPAWRDLLDEAALRRLARLASLRGGEQLVWLGAGGEKAAKQLEKICDARVKVRPDLDGIDKRSLGLIVAPELVEQIGAEKALKQLRAALETDGVMALVMRTAVSDEVSESRRAFWEQRQHGPLESVMEAFGRFSALGLEPLTVEFPSSPRAPSEKPEGTGEDDAELTPAVSSWDASGGVNLGLFVARRVEPGAPPRWPRRAGME